MNDSDARENREPESEMQIAGIPEMLGFIKSPELTELEVDLVDAITSSNDPELIKSLRIRYDDLSHEIIDQHPNTNKLSLQIGYATAKALIQKKVGNLAYYIEDLEELWQSTNVPELEYLVPVLRAEIRAATEELDRQTNS